MQSRIWPESYDPEGPCAGFSRLAWRLLGNDRSVGGRPLGNGPLPHTAIGQNHGHPTTLR